MTGKNSETKSGSTRNPLYAKIGKRIRQARLVARESNSRDLSTRLGWSAGRLHNYESGLSTPGVDETLQFCDLLKVDPSWITYGIGAPRPAELHSARYRNFIDALDQAEREGNLQAYLQAIRLPMQRLHKIRANPYSKIADVMARRCEKYLGKRRGWLDEAVRSDGHYAYLSEDVQTLLSIYTKLSPDDKRKFRAMGELLLS